MTNYLVERAEQTSLSRPSPNNSTNFIATRRSPGPVSATPSQFPSTDAYHAQGINCEAGPGLGPDDLGQSPERVEEKSSVFHLGLFRDPPLTVSQGLSPMSQAQTGMSLYFLTSIHILTGVEMVIRSSSID
jgi:hypothetical protein